MSQLTSIIVFCLAVTSSWAQTTMDPMSSTTKRPHRTHKPIVYDDLVTMLTNKTNFNTLLDLLKLTGLDTVLAAAPAVTVFAPTDDSFARLPAGSLDSLKNDVPSLTALLKYHVVGESAVVHGHVQDMVLKTLNNDMPLRLNQYGIVHVVSAEGVKITERDIHVSNGYLNVIDGVLSTPSGNVMDIISSRTDLSTLNSLLTSTNADDIIKADENITVFAPTDKAFSALDPSVLTYLQNNPKALQDVLFFHVVNRMTLYSIGMKHTLTFPAADRHPIMILEDNMGGIYVNHAKIIEKDLSAVNGVVHVIDQVLVPAKVLVGLEDQGLTVG